jgi:hypothetical protein
VAAGITPHQSESGPGRKRGKRRKRCVPPTAENRHGAWGGEVILDDRVYTRIEAMLLLRLRPATFSKLVNGKLKGVPPLICVRVGRRQLFLGRTLRQWLIDGEAMSCNGAH